MQNIDDLPGTPTTLYSVFLGKVETIDAKKHYGRYYLPSNVAFGNRHTISDWELPYRSQYRGHVAATLRPRAKAQSSTPESGCKGRSTTTSETAPRPWPIS